MKEVDKHIIDACKLLKCSFVEDGSVTELGNFTDESLFEFVVRFLWRVDPSLESIIKSYRLPPNTSEKFRVASAVVDKLKLLKVRGDYGYHVILYGTVPEVRNFCISIIEKLPRTNVTAEVATSLNMYFLQNLRIVNENTFFSELCRGMAYKDHWLPSQGPEVCPISLGSELKTEELLETRVTRPIISRLIDNNLFCKADQCKIESSQKTEPMLPTSADCLLPSVDKEADIRLKEKKEFLQELESISKNIKNDFYKTQHGIESLIAEKNGYRIDRKDKKRLAELLKDPEVGRTRILSFLQKLESSRAEHENEWIQVCAVKQEALNKLRLEKGITSTEDDLIEKIESVDATINDIKTRQNKIESSIPALRHVLEKCPENSINREELCLRLLEITDNYDKLNNELRKILKDIDVLRRELNWLSESLYRSFNIIEETLYRNTDDHKGEQMYRFFSRVNKKCTAAIEYIERNGHLARAIERLTDQIYRMKMENRSNNLPSDMKEVENENIQLVSYLGLSC